MATWYGDTGGEVIAGDFDADGDLEAGSGVVCTVWDSPTGGTQITDLIDTASNPITQVTTTSKGRARFGRPADNQPAVWVQTPDGERYLFHPRNPTVTATSVAWGDVTSKPTTFPPEAHTHPYTNYTDADARAAVGVTEGQVIPTLNGDNEWTGLNTFPASSIPSSALSGLDSVLDNYVATKGIYQAKTFANGTTPTFTPGVVWYELGAGVVGVPSAVLVTHNATSLDQTTYTFTPDNTMQAASVYIALVAAGTTTPLTAFAPIASSMTGRGLTWTKIGAGINQTNGATSLVAFRGVGTPTASGDLSVTFPAQAEGCHIEVVAVPNVSTTVTASKYATAGGNFTNPTVSLDAAPNAAHFQLLGLVINSTGNTVTADPGTPLGTTPDITSLTPAMATRMSWRSSAQQTSTWTKSASAQYAALSIVLTPA
jgi:hypothetical protein